MTTSDGQRPGFGGLAGGPGPGLAGPHLFADRTSAATMVERALAGERGTVRALRLEPLGERYGQAEAIATLIPDDDGRRPGFGGLAGGPAPASCSGADDEVRRPPGGPRGAGKQLIADDRFGCDDRPDALDASPPDASEGSPERIGLAPRRRPGWRSPRPRARRPRSLCLVDAFGEKLWACVCNVARRSPRRPAADPDRRRSHRCRLDPRVPYARMAWPLPYARTAGPAPRRA